MEIVQLPPIGMIEGEQYSATWLFREKTGKPIDFTQTVHGQPWSGRITFCREGCKLSEHPLGLTASGRIRLAITADDVAALRGHHVTFQINLDAPVPDLSEVWRGVVDVQ